jgi:hypothetical protein
LNRATQLPAQLGELCRAAAELRLEPTNMGREVAVLVDACAEQPLQRLGSSGYGDGRLVWRDLGDVPKRPLVAANGSFRGPSDNSPGSRSRGG